MTNTQTENGYRDINGDGIIDYQDIKDYDEYNLFKQVRENIRLFTM